MAAAEIILTNGTKVTIEGTSDEIAKILLLYGTASPSPSAPDVHPANESRARRSQKKAQSRSPSGVMQHVRTLVEERFFAERRSIADVQSKLEEGGRIYPLTHISTPLKRLVIKRELRRMKEGSNWMYVQP